MLAAGASVRMGRPKQLLPIDGRPLVTRAVEAAAGSGAEAVVLVVGFEAERVALAAGAPCPAFRVVCNYEWSQGMGSSLRVGLAALRGLMPEADGVLFALCDQPAFDAQVARRIAAAWTAAAPGKTIAAAAYAGRLGAPALFGRQHFGELAGLGGDEGARSLLQRHPDSIVSLDLPALALDLDTPGDIEAWARSELRSPSK